MCSQSMAKVLLCGPTDKEWHPGLIIHLEWKALYIFMYHFKKNKQRSEWMNSISLVEQQNLQVIFLHMIIRVNEKMMDVMTHA